MKIAKLLAIASSLAVLAPVPHAFAQESEQTAAPAAVEALKRQMMMVAPSRVIAAPSAASITPNAIVSNRVGRITIAVTVVATTPGIDTITCSALIYNAETTVYENAVGDATNTSGSIYRCNMVVNYRWNGVQDQSPLRVDVTALGLNPFLSGSTTLRSSRQSVSIPVPGDGAVTPLSFSLRL
jgi:hypothetical protein